MGREGSEARDMVFLVSYCMYLEIDYSEGYNVADFVVLDRYNAKRRHWRKTKMGI